MNYLDQPYKKEGTMLDQNHTKGTTSELIASIWLLKYGYLVFKNISDHGFFDLVAVREDEVLFLDVKTCRSNEQYSPLSQKQLDFGVLQMQATADGRCRIRRNFTDGRLKSNGPAKVSPITQETKVLPKIRFQYLYAEMYKAATYTIDIDECNNQ